MAKVPTESAFEPTPREEQLAKLAEEAKKVKPERYDIRNKNAKTPRVIHDFYGERVMIQPEKTKEGIWLRPNIAEYLGKGDLAVTASAGS